MSHGEVIQSSSAEDALKNKKINQADVILTDYNMGCMNGMELIQNLKSKGNDTPMIMITAHGSDKLSKEMINTHVFGYLEKPINPEEFDSVIQAAKEHSKEISHQKSLMAMGTQSRTLIHEITNPLFALSLKHHRLNTLAADDEELLVADKEFSRHLSGMGKGISKITNIMQSVQQLSEGSVVSPESFTVADLINSLKDTYEELFPDYLVINEKYGSAKLKGSLIQLTQVLWNLINNSCQAVKEYNEKWVKLNISLETNSVIFSVSDSGSGIPLEEREHIFKLNYSTKNDKGGSGIGLALSKLIAKKHHGDLYLNEKSSNTSFVLDLPSE